MMLFRALTIWKPATNWLGHLLAHAKNTLDEILIIDYKTNRPPPENPEDVPQQYLNQMNAYARALEKIYPNRKVRTALLWTNDTRLMEINGYDAARSG